MWKESGNLFFVDFVIGTTIISWILIPKSCTTTTDFVLGLFLNGLSSGKVSMSLFLMKLYSLMSSSIFLLTPDLSGSLLIEPFYISIGLWWWNVLFLGPLLTLSIMSSVEIFVKSLIIISFLTWLTELRGLSRISFICSINMSLSWNNLQVMNFYLKWEISPRKSLLYQMSSSTQCSETNISPEKSIILLKTPRLKRIKII